MPASFRVAGEHALGDLCYQLVTLARAAHAVHPRKYRCSRADCGCLDGADGCRVVGLDQFEQLRVLRREDAIRHVASERRADGGAARHDDGVRH